MNLDTLLKLLEGHQKNCWPLELDIDLSWYFSCFFTLINLSKITAIDSFLFSAKHRLGSFWQKNILSEIFWLYFQTAKCLLVPFCNYYAFFTCQREHWNERDALLLANLISFSSLFLFRGSGRNISFCAGRENSCYSQCSECWEFHDMQPLCLPMQRDTSSAVLLAQPWAF